MTKLSAAQLEARHAQYTEAIRPGDLLFTANGTPLSCLIRKITKCDYSHVIVCYDHTTGFQATDRHLTPGIAGGGIQAVDLATILRAPTITHLGLRRPVETPSQGRLWAAVEDLLDSGEHPPPNFSAAGLFWLAALYAVIRPDPGPIGRSIAGLIADILAEGPRTVTCSELATRIFERAGVNLGFGADEINRVVDGFPQPSDLDRSTRLTESATPGQVFADALALQIRHYGQPPAATTKRQWIVRTGHAVRGTIHAFRTPSSLHPGDQSDFVSPAWLYQSRAFTTIPLS